MDPLVSIIVSSYNYSAYLRDAIDSALGQSYPRIEVIVVDDGSTDDSPVIIKNYEGKIKYILKENGGQASAFNAGFRISRGDIIIFLDSDDILYPSAVEEAVRKFEEPGVVKVHWMLDEINADGKKTNKVSPRFALAEGDLRRDVIQYGPSRCGGAPYSPPTSGNAWARFFLARVLPIPEAEYRTCTDQYLQVLAPVYGFLRCINASLGGYRVHGSNYSLNPVEDYKNEYFKRFEQSCQILNQHLRLMEIEADAAGWPRDSWFHKMQACIDDILQVVPRDESFIHVDGDEWGIGDSLEGRKRKLFIERNGEYWGTPVNDDQAIEEIERQWEQGVGFIVFTWTTFWLLDFYTGMHKYLETHYNCALKNERAVIYKLRSD